MTLMVRKMKRTQADQRKKWWKSYVAFREKLNQALGGQEVLSDNWMTTTNVIRETDKRVLGVLSGRKADKKT